MTEIKAQLKIDGNADTIDLPVYQGSTGPDVVDVRGLVSQGVFTYDPDLFPRPPGVEDHLYRWGGRRPSPPWLPYRAAGGKIELPGDLLSAVARRTAG